MPSADARGDPTYRAIAAGTPPEYLAITHDYYDHSRSPCLVSRVLCAYAPGSLNGQAISIRSSSPGLPCQISRGEPAIS